MLQHRRIILYILYVILIRNSIYLLLNLHYKAIYIKPAQIYARVFPNLKALLNDFPNQFDIYIFEFILILQLSMNLLREGINIVRNFLSFDYIRQDLFDAIQSPSKPCFFDRLTVYVF